MELLLPLIVPVLVLALAGQAEESKAVKIAVVVGGALCLLLGLAVMFVALVEKGEFGLWILPIAILNAVAFSRSRNV